MRDKKFSRGESLYSKNYFTSIVYSSIHSTVFMPISYTPDKLLSTADAKLERPNDALHKCVSFGGKIREHSC